MHHPLLQVKQSANSFSIQKAIECEWLPLILNCDVMESAYLIKDV